MSTTASDPLPRPRPTRDASSDRAPDRPRRGRCWPSAYDSVLALPEDPEQMRAAIAGMVWAIGCTGKFAWPIPDRGLRSRLHRVSARTLILWGRNDKLADVAYAGEFANAITGSKVAIFDECGHIPQVECYQQTVQAVDEFLG